MTNERILWVDYLKALAIIGVIGIHCSSILLDDKYLFTLPWYESVVAASFFRFAIILFVMASGYLLLRKCQPVSSIPRRLKRILIPFVFWFIVYSIVKVVLKDVIGTSWTVLDLLLYIMDGFLNPLLVSVQFWYVYMILGLYLLSPVLSKWIQNAGMDEIEYFLLIWVIISILQFVGIESVLFDYLRYFTGSIGYFVLGYYLTVKDNELLNNNRFALLLLVVGLLFTVCGTIFMSHMNLSQSLFFIRLGDLTPGACLEAVGLFILVKNIDYSKFKPKINDIVIKISKDSYGVYLVNILVINLLEKLHFVHLERFTFLMIILTMLVVFVISELIVEILYRIPYTRRFSGRG